MEQNDTFLEKLERFSYKAFIGAWIIGGAVVCSTPLYDSYRFQTPTRYSVSPENLYSISEIKFFYPTNKKDLEQKLE